MELDLNNSKEENLTKLLMRQRILRYFTQTLQPKGQDAYAFLERKLMQHHWGITSRHNSPEKWIPDHITPLTRKDLYGFLSQN